MLLHVTNFNHISCLLSYNEKCQRTTKTFLKNVTGILKVGKIVTGTTMFCLEVVHIDTCYW